jgi:hypothetical protein
MTLLEELQAQLQIAEETRGLDAPVTRMIRQEVEEMRQKLRPVPLLRPAPFELLRYQTGFRKGQQEEG